VSGENFGYAFLPEAHRNSDAGDLETTYTTVSHRDLQISSVP